jgi:hypothetical protein
VALLARVLASSTALVTFAGIVGACFLGSGLATLAVALLARFGWRRGKDMKDL